MTINNNTVVNRNNQNTEIVISNSSHPDESKSASQRVSDTSKNTFDQLSLRSTGSSSTITTEFAPNSEIYQLAHNTYDDKNRPLRELSFCDCEKLTRNLEQVLLERCIEKVTSFHAQTDLITIVCIGPGGCFREVKYLARLIESGYKNLKLILIDGKDLEPEIKCLVQFMAKNCHLTEYEAKKRIIHYYDLGEYPKEPNSSKLNSSKRGYIPKALKDGSLKPDLLLMLDVIDPPLPNMNLMFPHTTPCSTTLASITRSNDVSGINNGSFLQKAYSELSNVSSQYGICLKPADSEEGTTIMGYSDIENVTENNISLTKRKIVSFVYNFQNLEYASTYKHKNACQALLFDVYYDLNPMKNLGSCQKFLTETKENL